MSTIKATTLSNLAGSKTVPTDTVVDGSAKAWVTLNGTGTVAINRAFNVSSITDIGVGRYQVNFTSSMADANYAVNTTPNGNLSDCPWVSSVTASSCSLNFYSSGAYQDPSWVAASIFS